MKMVYDEWYGELSFAQRSAYRTHNIPPALHQELVEYFGAASHAAITAYVKSKPRNAMNYGDVFRDRPDKATGITAIASEED